MASAGKKKTTFAKLARESKLRERRLAKQAKKAARRQSSEAGPGQLSDTPTRNDREEGGPVAAHPPAASAG
jgi:hypothetical protein